MDKNGVKKLLLTAAVAVSAAVGSPQPVTSAEKQAAGLEQLATLPESVQNLYRPVTLLAKLPGIPQKRGDKAWFFWKEQVARCRVGWTAPDGHRLNGYQYFYLNFLKIPIQDQKTRKAIWAQPWHRDNDEHILGQLWRNTARTLANGQTVNARNHVEAKCRSIGWTQLSLLGVGLHTFVFRPDRAIGMGYSDDEVIAKEKLWFQESWARLHPVFRTWQGHILEPLYNNKDAFVVGWLDPKNPKIKHEHNSCLFKIIPDNKAGVFKGLRLNLIVAVEAGKWKGDSLKNFYSENLDCLEMGYDKWGMFLIGGTSNAIINKSTNYKEIFFNPQAFNATAHFTPKTMVLNGYWDLSTGRSNTAGAMVLILAERKKKESDAQAYAQYVIENPLTPQEAFTPNEAFAYDSAKINAQIGWVVSNNYDTEMWRRGRLDYELDYTRNRRTGRIKFYEDPKGYWLVNLAGLPSARYKNLHIAGFDDTYKGAEESKLRARDSRNCLIVYRQPTAHNIQNDMPVGIFLRQLPDMDDVYEEVLKGLRYWEVNQCLYEYNHDGFVNFLRAKNELRRLYYIDKKPGLSIKGKVKTELTYLGHAYFREGRHQHITSREILESLLVWGSQANTDIGSAFHLVLHLLDQTKNREVTTRTSAEERLAQPVSTPVMLGPAVRQSEWQPVVAADTDRKERGSAHNRESRPFVRLGPNRRMPTYEPTTQVA